MSYSILQVRYKNEKEAPAVLECEDEASERRKIAEVKFKDQVARIDVYRCQRSVSREEVWTETPYAPPVKDADLPTPAKAENTK